MRRLVFSIVLGLGLVTVGGTGASAADPTPTATVSAKATPGKKVCKVKDPLLDEVSGLVATKGGGFIAIDDSSTDAGHRKVFFLDSSCAIKDDKSYPSNPLDTEDMIVSPKDGSVWIADTGDNAILKGDDPRPHVALWNMPANGKKAPVIYRLSYPEGDKHDSEALLMAPDGTPYIVTKEVTGAAFIYKPSGPLKANNKTPVPMVKAGEVAIQPTETPSNAFAKTFNRVVTGGAVSADGSKVVLRTYTDAMEWDVKNGDIVGALKGKPRTTGLPNEQYGEAIAYSADGKSFLTVSDMNGDKETANYIRSYEPATTVAVNSKKQSGGAAAKSWYSDLDVSDITNLVAGVGVLGLLLVGAGVFGIVRFRKQNPRGASVDDAPSGGIAAAGDPETELIGVGSGGIPPRGGAAYAAGGNGPVYGAKSGPPAGAAPQYARPAGQPPQGPRGPQQRPQGGGQQQQPRPPQPQRGPQQGQPGRGGPQQQPRGPQQRPQGGGGQQQPRGPQQRPQGGGGQQQPRGPQQRPQAGGQQPPPRGPQQQPGRGGGGGVYGGQQGGGQPRPPQGGQRLQGGPRPQGGGQPRPQGQGQPRPQGQGQPRPPQGGGPQRQAGMYGGGRPPQGRDDGGYNRR
ncbi:hypothetical protein BJY16_000327 [Actinoplanes octamycinicus]|uniref:Uncharacterized protein n=1 Tax=Actinoplanes octamycinicus TaxID=135948 RepID=A0A7W7GRE0_9ACTN|nr:hypothetical protein [Actinoplanes octamycinicus]MBB4736868.1 hypothetical protein [Actinoplanes octamycinicus]